MVDVADVRDPTRLTFRKWALMAGGWSLLTIPTVVKAATAQGSGPALRIWLALAVVAYAVVYVFGLYAAIRRKSPWFSAAVMLALATLWALTAGVGDGVYAVAYLIVGLAMLVPMPWNALGAAAACLAALGIEWQVTGNVAFDDVVGMVAVTVAMFGMFGVIRANAQLRAAREQLAELAVTAERERMARDLHDVLGHSLTTITVKAGLARRLLEGGEQERAAAEVSDVERLGRQALAEVRSTVAANRVASLGRELAGAREALRAAGIEAELPVAIDDVPAERQQVFAHVVREGVTNAIRHSGASRLAVRLTPVSVEVLDDGVGSPAGTPAGHGISGLTERLAAIGGWLDAGPLPDGGYRLRAECLPAKAKERT